MEQRILEARDMDHILTRMADEILGRYLDIDRLALVGIHTRGAFLAERLARRIEEKTARPVKLGSLDITLYRDDWTRITHHPVLRATHIPFDVDEMDVVLVDDVLYTGRTTKAAMDGLIDFGRPRCIGLAVLVDRGNRELPVHGDFVGCCVKTKKNQSINVKVAEHDGEDLVLLEET